MATNQYDGLFMSGIAHEAIVAHTFVNMTGTTANEAKRFSIADTTDVVAGVACHDAAEGAPLTVCYFGKGPVKVDGSGTGINADTKLKPSGDSDGIGIAVSANNDSYGAIANGPSSADGDVIDCRIVGQAQHGA